MSNNARTAAEQHDIIGYKSSEKEFTRTDDAGAKWFFEKTNLGLFIHFGISAAGDDIDISWGMMDNPDRRAKGNGILTPREYWALAEKFDPKHFEPKKWLSAAKDAGLCGFHCKAPRRFCNVAVGCRRFFNEKLYGRKRSCGRIRHSLPRRRS